MSSHLIGDINYWEPFKYFITGVYIGFAVIIKTIWPAWPLLLLLAVLIVIKYYFLHHHKSKKINK